MFTREYVNTLMALCVIDRDYGQAMMFALEQKLSVHEVVSLTWTDLRKMQLTPFAREIIDSRVRHLRLKQVFWAEEEGHCHPLLDFESVVFETFGKFFGEVANFYSQLPGDGVEASREKLVEVLINTVV